MGQETFSHDQLRSLTTLNLVLSVFSLIGSSFIVFMYLKVPELRSFAFRLVFYISLSDIFYSLGNMMADPGGNIHLCRLQAVIISYFELASAFWTVMIAYTLDQTILKNNSSFSIDIEQQAKRYHIFCWGLPAFLTILPFTSNSYGDAGAWCWIRTSNNYNAGTAWRFIQFYIPLWICIIYNAIVYVRVTRKLRVLDQARVPDAEDEVGGRGVSAEAASASVLDRTKYYPMVLIICYFFGTINRIVEIFGHSSYVLTVLHTLGASSQGTLNCIVYGLTPAVRLAFRNLVSDFRSTLGMKAQRASQVSDLAEFESLPEDSINQSNNERRDSLSEEQQ